jgi:hypothetical protein
LTEIGLRKEELDTPVLGTDVDTLESNIATAHPSASLRASLAEAVRWGRSRSQR